MADGKWLEIRLYQRLMALPVGRRKANEMYRRWRALFVRIHGERT